jgi:hypothetical protein
MRCTVYRIPDQPHKMEVTGSNSRRPFEATIEHTETCRAPPTANSLNDSNLPHRPGRQDHSAVTSSCSTSGSMHEFGPVGFPVSQVQCGSDGASPSQDQATPFSTAGELRDRIPVRIGHRALGDVPLLAGSAKRTLDRGPLARSHSFGGGLTNCHAHRRRAPMIAPCVAG